MLNPDIPVETDPNIERIRSHPLYEVLRSKRNRLGWILTIAMFIVYYGYIALIAFDKAFLARPVGAGVMTLGIPIGVAVIVFTVAVVGYYVRRANSEYDTMTSVILKDAAK